MRKAFRILLLPFAFFVVALTRLGVPLRFGELFSGRIGHLVGNMEMYFCERAAGISNGWDIWYHRGEPCNVQAAKMIEREVVVGPAVFWELCNVVSQLFSGWEKHHISTAQVDRDIHNLLGKHPPTLRFTAEEERLGEKWLVLMGVPRGSKWVCLIVRDGAYLPGLQYHSYRDSDVETYTAAALALAAQGYYVFRMGAKVAKPWSAAKGGLLIDYATKHRSDFMDVYLTAKCEFAISNGCGLDAVCTAFRRPVVYCNYVPIEYLSTWNPGSLAIWKHHEKDGKRMTLAEIYASGAGKFMRADEFEEAGITLVDNTPAEITAVVREMVEPGSETQEEFWKAFPRSSDGAPLHGDILMRIGREFLKGYA